MFRDRRCETPSHNLSHAEVTTVLFVTQSHAEIVIGSGCFPTLDRGAPLDALPKEMFQPRVRGLCFLSIHSQQ